VKEPLAERRREEKKGTGLLITWFIAAASPRMKPNIPPKKGAPSLEASQCRSEKEQLPPSGLAAK
jgi:hypothetical protein